jgi:hypothetical protein
LELAKPIETERNLIENEIKPVESESILSVPNDSFFKEGPRHT